ncbi:MAG: hypothetical protein ACI8UQ_001799, partial [Bacteroidia bacterium]
GGIAKFDGSTWTDYDETDGMVGPTIRALAVDENDAIWVATSSGVTKIGEEGASVKLMAKESLKVYPNPTADGTIHFGKVLNNVTVYDVTGTVVSSATDTESIAIETTGLYFVKSTTDGLSSTARVIVK